MGKMEIDPASWTALNRLLDDALDRPPAERAQWIESLAGEFASLKPQLRDLLARAASVETGEFMSTVPKFGPEGAVSDAPPSQGPAAGEQMGGYRLVRKLGAGGMGSVWLAERADGLIQRPVALKLPHVVAAQAAGLAERMARERAILATLDHRNIAKLLDAGITADGQPFLALEFVEGVPIDRRCTGEAGGAPLDLRARLGLFRQVADAVAYAHGKLIVHRDLKPANILVTPEGGAKLLDFGIAKLLSAGIAAETRLTELSGRALTPDYASPEQILGEPLTVASDVYSLGVILYELLTGTRPYKLKRDSRGALEDAILQSEPARPSQVCNTGWRRQLQGDLDTIALKALKKNPQERYATVNALADDIARHLDNRPVLARPDSTRYRLRKFIVRNKLGVSLSAVVMLAIVVGTGVTVWQARVAVAEQRRADDVKDFLVELFKSANPSDNGGRKVTVDQLLLASQAKIDERFANRPEIRTELLVIVGQNLAAIGEGPASLPIFEEAAATAEKAFGPDHELTLQARSAVLDARLDLDPVADLRADADQLIVAMRRNPKVDPSYLSNLLAQRAYMATNVSNFPEAVKFATEALEVSSTRLGETTDLNLNNATLVAHAHQRNKDWRRALEAATEVRRLVFEVRKLPGDDFNAVDARLMHGMALADAGQMRAGLDEMGEAMRFALVRRAPDDAAIGSFRTHLARYQLRAGLEREALENSLVALDIVRKAHGDKSRRVAAASAWLGWNYLTMRRPADAVAPLQDAAALFAGSTDLGNVLVPARLAVARALSQPVKPDLAIAGDHKNWEIPFLNAQLERLAKRPAAAQALLQQSMTLLGDAPADQMRRAEATLEMGRVSFDLGQFEAARRSFTEAIGMMRAAQLNTSAPRADAELWLGKALLALHSPEAAPALEAAAADWASVDPSHPLAAEARRELVALRTPNAASP